MVTWPTAASAATEQPVRSIWWWGLSAPQLKILQEIITISVFVVINFVYLKERVRPTDWAAFALIILAVAVMMYPRVVAAREQQLSIREAAQRLDQVRNNNLPGDSK